MIYFYQNNNNEKIVEPSYGYTLATQITCTPPTVEINAVNFLDAATITWYFGDGENVTVTASQGLTATHSYKFPGTYQISAVAYVNLPDSYETHTYVAVASTKIVNYIDNAVYYTIIPPPTLPGFYTQYPYKIIFTTSNVELQPKIDLYAEFPRSYPPQDPTNKWSFVRPEWKFVNLSGQRVNYVEPTYKVIKIDGTGVESSTGIPVGLSGEAEFYFIDDIYSVDFFIKDAPTPIVWASIETSAINVSKDSDIKSGKIYGYSTTEVRAYAPHVSYWKMPDYLEITENGVQDLVNPKWTNAITPFFVSAQIDTTKVGKISAYDPDVTFCKYLPYAVSARGPDYVPCAEDVPVYVTVSGSASATFDAPITNNLGGYAFNQIDAYGFAAPGFTRGLVTVHDEGSMVLSAKAIVDFKKMHLPEDALIYNPYIWIPNPIAGTLSMIYYSGALNKQFALALHNQFSTNSIKNIFTPYVNEINTTSQGLTGFNGMYAVAVSPGNEPDFEYYTWVADADLDMLYKYDTLTKIVTSVDLKAALGIHKVSPAYISLDHDKNMWVTCYDTVSVLKFDRDGNFLFGVDPSPIIIPIDPGIPGIFDVSPPAAGIFDDVLIVEPTGVDTDTQNNVWVSYSNPISSYIVKYSSTGILLASITLPLYSTPQDILIDRDDTFWVAHTYEIYGVNGCLKKYDTTGAELSSFDNIPNLGYLTYDVDGNPWFTYEYNKVGKIKNDTFTHVATVTSSYTFTNLNIPPMNDGSGYIQYAALEGISGSHKNLIFVVHSIDNKVYVYNAKDDSHIDTIDIKPQGSLGHYNDNNANRHDEEQWNKSIQVIGDWTGLRWSRKYRTFPTEKILTGTSKPLNFSKLNTQEIRKHNQDFNMTEQLQSFAMVPSFNNNDFLFNRFFNAIYGDSTYIDDVGTTLYEKIANFLDNNVDIDTCEIDSLYKLADSIDVSIDDYRLAFPAQLKQVMNLLTISHSKLWGDKCKCNMNFRNQQTCTGTDVCKICGISKLNNRGEKIDTVSNQLTAGVPVVVYEKNIDSYFLHYPASYNGVNLYPASQLTAAGLMFPVEQNYDFYMYNSQTNNSLVEGVIDWNNTYTTLNPNISTYNEWIKEGGVIDTMLHFYLYRGLKLI